MVSREAKKKKKEEGDFPLGPVDLSVQWALSAGSTGSVPGWRTKIPHAVHSLA